MTARSGSVAGISGVTPPQRLTQTSMPHLRSADRPKAKVVAAPTKSMAAAAPPLSFRKALVARVRISAHRGRHFSLSGRDFSVIVDDGVARR